MKTPCIAMLFLGFMMITSSCNKSDLVESLDTESENFYRIESGTIIKDHYIVTFQDNFVSSSKYKIDQSHDENLETIKKIAENIEIEHSGVSNEITNTYYKTIQGFAGVLSEELVLKLKKDPRIKSIEPDRVISLKQPDNPGNKPSKGDTQITPYGITRVNGGSSAIGKVAWILDSGVDLNHPDLNVNAKLSKVFLGTRKKGRAEDRNGHGTHVAGIIAAIDNEIGVIGVAAGATVVAVKVLDDLGNGTLSGIIQGVEYVAANASSEDVANISVGGGISIALDAAVIEASKTCPFVIAAGNNADDADNYSPARAETSVGTIYTVSAMNTRDNFANFSNYGSHIDYCEPGVNIQSCWKSGAYNTISGTSMAAPHLAGLILIGFIQDGTVNNDPDGNADPIAIHELNGF